MQWSRSVKYRVSKKTDTFAANLNNKGVSFFLLTLYDLETRLLRSTHVKTHKL
jgi:hypothetical protein